METGNEAACLISRKELVPGTYTFLRTEIIGGKLYNMYTEAYEVFYTNVTSKIVTEERRVYTPSKWIKSRGDQS